MAWNGTQAEWASDLDALLRQLDFDNRMGHVIKNTSSLQEKLKVLGDELAADELAADEVGIKFLVALLDKLHDLSSEASYVASALAGLEEDVYSEYERRLARDER